jgi:hypothetical protein
MMQTDLRRPLRRAAAGVLLAATGALAACDAPTAPGERAAAGGPRMLITPACTGTGGATHPEQTLTASQTWTRASSPHRVTGTITLDSLARLTIAPGAVVCFEPGAGLRAQGGARLHARGRDTARVVFTGRDPAQGWRGIELTGAPAGPSYLTNVLIEHVNVDRGALTTQDQHPVYADSAVIRRSGHGVMFNAPGSRLIRSAVDSTTNRIYAAVYLGAGSFEHSVVRRSAGPGVIVNGPNVLLLGGRIQESTGVGLWIFSEPLSPYSRAVRVVGGMTHPAELSLASFVKLYPTPGLQDSLLGNARETPVVGGGILRTTLTVGPRLPLRIVGEVMADSGGAVVAQPGARIFFGRGGGITARNGGRLVSRGSAASPVLLTAENPAVGWRGLRFDGSVASTSYVTNTRLELTGPSFGGVTAYENHRVIVDSSVIRHTAFAALLHSPNSRLMRTRVDTTLNSDWPAVELGGNARMESTRIRASAGIGVRTESSAVVVASCELIDGEKEGIVMQVFPVAVHNCNLVNNLGVGIRNDAYGTADATGNWWGSTGGPSGPGGDGAAGPLTVSPWRTTPFVLPYVP